jgi:hypothetical protein
MKLMSTAALLVLASSAVATAQEEGSPALSATIDVFEVLTSIDDEGQEIRTEVLPTDVVPTDTVLVRANIQNEGVASVTDIGFTFPVDASLHIDVDSLEADVPFQYSFATHQEPSAFGPLAELSVALEDGSIRPATSEDVGHIRVVIPELDAAKNVTIEYTASLR